jgi:hypothetical protein
MAGKLPTINVTSSKAKQIKNSTYNSSKKDLKKSLSSSSKLKGKGKIIDNEDEDEDDDFYKNDGFSDDEDAAIASTKDKNKKSKNKKYHKATRPNDSPNIVKLRRGQVMSPALMQALSHVKDFMVIL